MHWILCISRNDLTRIGAVHLLENQDNLGVTADNFYNT
mgnify:CR=1 FL=1